MIDLKTRRNIRLYKPESFQKRTVIKTMITQTGKIKNTGTCLGDCVICGASCCLDAGHPGPHYCYLCK